jgi:predicted metalloenzyme YecM
MKEVAWLAVLADAEPFGNRLKSALQKIGIYDSCRTLPICHVCVRLKDPDNVTHLKDSVSKVGTIISSVTVNGRNISIVQLDQPLSVDAWSIPAIELPYPKPNHKYVDGLEHVEFIFLDTDNAMDAVRSATLSVLKMSTDELIKYYDYSEDVPHADNDQKPNPTIAIAVDGIGIKFHAISIQEVVGYIS